MAKLYKIKTTASPNIGFPFPDLGIYINQELFDSYVDKSSQIDIVNVTASTLTDNYFRNALKDVEGIFKHRNIYYNYFSEENQQFSTGNNKHLWDCLRQIGNVKIIRNMSNSICDLIYNGQTYGRLDCFTNQAGAGGSGYRVNSGVSMGGDWSGYACYFGGYSAPCDYSSNNFGYYGSSVSGFSFHVFPENIINEDTGEIQNDGSLKAVKIQLWCQDHTNALGTYTYIVRYLGTELVSQITNSSMFYGTIPEEVNVDPYAGGGSTNSGGGEGTFDPSGDTIGVPNLPTISAIDTGFVSIWKPTKTQLKNLYNYLWSGLDLNTFKKIFANPIDTIMGFSIIPLTPTTGTDKELKVGNIGTGINVTPVTEQYYEIDCGTITIPEFFGSYLDYEPYTTIDLYLPYIGSVRISTDDIKRNPPNNGTIQLIYHIDILSGSCVVFVVTNGTVSYQYNGSILTQLPITGNDFTSTINSVLGLTSNIVGGVMSASTGNAAGVLGNSVNAAHNVTSAKPSINRSGNISGSGGFLGIQKPFLIMNLPKQAIAFAQNTFTGYPAHITNSIKSLTGYTEFEQIWIEKVPATENELSEIESILTSGVIL